jgi:hypothetical protein
MIATEFLEEIRGLVEKYPDYEVVICNCVVCITERPFREDNWAVNHAVRRIYL